MYNTCISSVLLRLLCSIKKGISRDTWIVEKSEQSKKSASVQKYFSRTTRYDGYSVTVWRFDKINTYIISRCVAVFCEAMTQRRLKGALILTARLVCLFPSIETEKNKQKKNYVRIHTHTHTNNNVRCFQRKTEPILYICRMKI